jgi:LPXTG-motif cell wall-anchored protein
MPRSTSIARMVTAALAVLAFAAPSALARPIQDLPTKAQTKQDLRMPDTKDAAAAAVQRATAGKIRTSSLAGTTSPKGDVFWSYDYPAGTPKKTTAPVPAADRPSPVPATGGGTDTPWATIAIAFAAAMLGGAGGAVAARRTRRSRVAA